MLFTRCFCMLRLECALIKLFDPVTSTAIQPRAFCIHYEQSCEVPTPAVLPSLIAGYWVGFGICPKFQQNWS